VASKEFIIDLSSVDFDNVVADIEEIRKYNPQRGDMEQLTAIVHEDTKLQVVVGYKDVGREEFWVTGHMPGMPLMPGVLMLEAAAQTSSYFVQKHRLLGADVVGFGGLEGVRFRDPVIPGDRLILMSQLLKARPGRMMVCRFQGVVRDSLVVEGTMKGIAIPVERFSKGG
jgi:3-hydroxyacyl-[acyl-carrier-protein] dehydratase